jgi:hypothetical protein
VTRWGRSLEARRNDGVVEETTVEIDGLVSLAKNDKLQIRYGCYVGEASALWVGAVNQPGTLNTVGGSRAEIQFLGPIQ